MRLTTAFALCLFIFGSTEHLLSQADVQKPIRGAHYPALSPDGKLICFEYLGDLWTASVSGGTAHRLTINRAYDAFPRWSPDGKWIAFSSNREGNLDVYVIPAKGGEPKQITFHSADDTVLDWSPDGSRLLFMSAREGRFPDLYTISLKDNSLRRITADRTPSRYGAYSPDGKTIAYERGGQNWSRPRYKGSQNADVWTIPSMGGKATRITDFDGWDSWPVYTADGKSIYEVSERSGSSNIWRIPLPGGPPVQTTRFDGDAIRNLTISRDGSRLAFERDFRLWTLGVGKDGSESTEVVLYAPTDTLDNMDRHTTLTTGAGSISLSQDTKTIAFAARGEIWTCPADGGDATRITNNGSAEYSPAWNGDGKFLAYVTDRNGNLDIVLTDVKTKTEKLVTTDPADDTALKFSPDGHFLAWERSGGKEPGLYVLPIAADGTFKPDDAARILEGAGVGSYDWSPDNRWIVCSRRDAVDTNDLWIAPTVGGTAVNVTRYPGFNANPVWSRDGKWIVYMSTRGTGAAASANLYSIRLLPVIPKDDGTPEEAEANPTASDEGDEGLWITDAQRRRPPPTPPSEAPQTAPPPQPGMPPHPVVPLAKEVRIDFDDIQNRAVPVTNTRDNIGQFGIAPDGRTVIYSLSSGGQSDWWAVDLVGGASMRLTTAGESGSDMEFAQNGSSFLYIAAGGAIRKYTRQTGQASAVVFNATLDIDRRVEIAEAFNEAWRTLRTQFYDPKMHGANWLALRSKYEPIVNEIVAKEDFSWLLSAMIGELNASHVGATPPTIPGPTTVTGCLGLVFDQDYAGPGLKVASTLAKGPSAVPGRKIEPGEFVLAIDGKDVLYNEDTYRLLRDKVGQTVELTVNVKPVKEGARVVKVRPITKVAEDDREYEAWVAARRKKVDELSNGKLAYLHIKGMDQVSLARFQREIYGDAQTKQGVVIDVRFNGGGRISAELLDILTRKPNLVRIPRDGEKSFQPSLVWNRPAVLLINEFSASDAEIFPNGFREFGLGKIVGVATMGAVIGTSDITLVDGTRFRIPATGAYRLDGTNLENLGIQPDIRVEQTPEDNANDNDRQLEAAVNTLMEQLSKGK